MSKAWPSILVLLSLVGSVAAVEPAHPAKPAPIPTVTLRLEDCVGIAFGRAPTLTAVRAEVAIAEKRLEIAENAGLAAELLRRELPVRRQQGRIGLSALQANLRQIEQDTIYAVTRTYYGIQYARVQLGLLDENLQNAQFYEKRIQEIIKAKTNPEWGEATLDLVRLFQRLIAARRVEAVRGIELATAALREAMGVEPGACLNIAVEELPDLKMTLCRADVVTMALARNGRLITAAALADIARLEVDAQAATRLPGTVRTFAAYADIHAEPVPTDEAREEYRPGGLAPAMPTVLVGDRAQRMQLAELLAVRTQAVAEKTRNLVALHAEDAYLTWDQLQQQKQIGREARALASSLLKRLSDELQREAVKIVIEVLLTNAAVSSRAQADYNEAVYKELVALANLERVTVGGVSVGFPGRPCVPVPTSPASAGASPTRP